MHANVSLKGVKRWATGFKIFSRVVGVSEVFPISSNMCIIQTLVDLSLLNILFHTCFGNKATLNWTCITQQGIQGIINSVLINISLHYVGAEHSPDLAREKGSEVINIKTCNTCSQEPSQIFSFTVLSLFFLTQVLSNVRQLGFFFWYGRSK